MGGGPALATVALVSTIVGGGAAVYSTYQSGQAAKAQAQYQAAVARNNEIMAKRLAEDARLRGDEEARKARKRAEQLAARQRAALAANGVAVDEGSAIDLLGDTIQLGEAEAQTLRSNAEREALGYIMRAQGFAADSALADMTASQAGSATGIGVASTIINTAGSVASNWYEYKKENSNYSFMGIG